MANRKTVPVTKYVAKCISALLACGTHTRKVYATLGTKLATEREVGMAIENCVQGFIVALTPARELFTTNWDTL